MIKKIGLEVNEYTDASMVKIGEAGFPAPFKGGLEFASPARGTWNIVHTGMLIPEVHEIFVCAASCLRGVVLTAAEMNALDRFSTVEVKENNLLDGNLEELLIDGVSDIIDKLDKRPPAVLVYTSCVHHFTGCDWGVMFGTLKERFPDIDIIDCYMNPTLRKSGLNPDQTMRRQLYALLKAREINPASVAIIGNDLPTKENSDLYRILQKHGLKIHEITSCKSYDEYQEMAESSMYITYYPAAKASGDALAKRLGGKHIYLPYSWDYDEIQDFLELLEKECGNLEAASSDASYMNLGEVEDKNLASEGSQGIDLSEVRVAECENAFKETLNLIGDTPIAIDYTFCPRPTSVAKQLLAHGFNVRRIYLDSFTGEEKGDYEYLKGNYPDLELYPTVDVKSRFFASGARAIETRGSCNTNCGTNDNLGAAHQDGNTGSVRWLAIGQ